MDPLSAPGVAVDVDALLALRHIAPERANRATRATTLLPGGLVSKRRGRGLETADIRVFHHGDDPRHIDRNATARTGVPHVRAFQDERDRTTLLLADFRPSMHWGTQRALRSVACAEAIALIGWQAIASGGRVGLIAFGGPSPIFVPTRGRERGMIALVGGLVSAHRAALAMAADDREAPVAPLSEVLEMADHIAPGGASVVLASSLDDMGEGFDTAATALRHRKDLTVLLIRDRFETDPQSGAYPFETEQGQRGIGRVGERTEAADSILRRLDRLGIATVPLDAGAAPPVTARRLEQADGG